MDGKHKNRIIGCQEKPTVGDEKEVHMIKKIEGTVFHDNCHDFHQTERKLINKK